MNSEYANCIPSDCRDIGWKMKNTKQTTLLGHSLIWFGAAVSIAEILTGTLFAPMGFGKAFWAIVLGHLLGCLLLYCAGVISARNGTSAMESAKNTFGSCGGQIFAGLNVLQLVGWTAVMISAGGQAANGICRLFGWNCSWHILIGAMILLWLQLKFRLLEKANLVTMLLLFGLSLLLSRVVFKGAFVTPSTGGVLSFGEALELSIAMPVSWLPIVGDYTRDASRPRLASMVSAGVYFAVSCWMYLVGLCAVLCLGEADIAVILQNAGLGVAALLIVILSTVTTTYLDVFSAGISAGSILPKTSFRLLAGIVCLLGTVLAMVCDTSSFEAFLYWIGSVFVPMATIQIVDELLLRQRHSARHNLLLWLAGFLIYRIFLQLNLPCGSTIPDILLTASLCFAFRKKGILTDADILVTQKDSLHERP